jgi:fumarate hydratase subunit alpha
VKRIIDVRSITETVKKLCLSANFDLPDDVEKSIKKCADVEKSQLCLRALAQIKDNIEIARSEEIPLCQDTGIVSVFLELGQEVTISGGQLTEAVNKGVREAYGEGYLRKSIVKDPLFDRLNTGDNTPAVIYCDIVAGDKLKIIVMPKGAGSENMCAIKMLKPAEGLQGVEEFILQTVKNADGNPCPPIFVGVGVGGTMEQAALLSKKALALDLDYKYSDERYAELAKRLLDRINQLGIGAQGFGGDITALGVNILSFPTHIATLPVAVSINCHAARHKEVIL